jgi:hypothetical protein
MFIVDSDGISRTVTFLVMWDHHRDIKFLQTLFGQRYTDISAGGVLGGDYKLLDD